MIDATQRSDLIPMRPPHDEAESAETLVARAWRRAAETHRIDRAAAYMPQVLTVEELGPLREQSAALIAAARPELDHLYTLIRPLKYVVLLSDANGVVVDHRSEYAENPRYRYWGSFLGGVWSEAAEGTNGIGTSIAEARAVTIHKDQHYRTRHSDLSCSGAPVFADTGAVSGVVCLTSIDSHLSDHAHGMAGALAISSARAIEERLFREKYRRYWIVAIRTPEISAGAFMAVDRDHRIVGAGRIARKFLSDSGYPFEQSPSFWSLFERDKKLTWHIDQADYVITLRPRGRDALWTAVITPPLAQFSGTQEMQAFQTRARLSTFVTGRQPAPLPQIPQVSRGGLSPALISRLRGFIDNHLDQNIDLRALATEAQLSPYHFARSFKQAQGITPHRFILERRLARARELLRQENLPLSEIAVAVGFADQSHFTRRFRDREGMSPGQFRKLLTENRAAA